MYTKYMKRNHLELCNSDEEKFKRAILEWRHLNMEHSEKGKMKKGKSAKGKYGRRCLPEGGGGTSVQIYVYMNMYAGRNK